LVCTKEKRRRRYFPDIPREKRKNKRKIPSLRERLKISLSKATRVKKGKEGEGGRHLWWKELGGGKEQAFCEKDGKTKEKKETRLDGTEKREITAHRGKELELTSSIRKMGEGGK